MSIQNSYLRQENDVLPDVYLFVCLSVCLSVNNLMLKPLIASSHEFHHQMYLWSSKNRWRQILKVVRAWIRIKEFLKDFSTMRDSTSSHNLDYVFRKTRSDFHEIFFYHGCINPTEFWESSGSGLRMQTSFALAEVCALQMLLYFKVSKMFTVSDTSCKQEFYEGFMTMWYVIPSRLAPHFFSCTYS